MGATGALDGIRVLDLSRVLAGPWATQTLGDLGAEIIKIERPGSGDETRAWGPPNFDATGCSAYFACANRNKRSVTVDFTRPAGRELIVALAQRADVLVENFRVGAAARHGLDYATLSRHNPRLVYCAISGFGQDGPAAQRPGYDAMIQGMSGLMSITGRAAGEPGAGPQKTGVAVVDVATGLYAAIAILAALAQRTRTGLGQYIDLALFDVSLALLANQGMNFLATGRAPAAQGNAHPSIVPYQDFATLDGWIMLAVGNDGQFGRFCRCIGHAELLADERFARNPQRVAHRRELVSALAPLMRERSTRAWLELLEANEIPCGPINDIAAAFAEPQARARGSQVELGAHASGDAARTVLPGIASPLRLSSAPAQYALPPPALGAHTREVLREQLGLSHAQLDELASQGAI